MKIINNKKFVNKPWGYEEVWACTAKYSGKILVIRPGCSLSRQYHNIKEETIYVLEGHLRVEIGSKNTGIKVDHLDPGQVMHIPPKTVHRFCAEDDEVKLIEVSTPELDDVVRIEDFYGRTNK
jgi:mannose-6-phosphate isomerase